MMHKQTLFQIKEHTFHLRQAVLRKCPLLQLSQISFKFLFFIARDKIPVIPRNVFQLVRQRVGIHRASAPAARIFRNRDDRNRIPLFHPVCPDEIPLTV